MSLSKALLGWKGNLTTFIPADYVLMLRMDVNAFSDAAKELELENDELRAENEKLKNQNKWLRKEYTSLRKTRELEFAASCEAATNSMGQIGTLRDKNVELRELVHHMCTCMCNIVDADYACEDCPMNNDTQNCDFERRIEELGIEV